MENFDYGKRLTDGQFERHPTQTDGGFVAPIRNAYIHSKCGGKTFMGDDLAETYAKHPDFYTGTFCAKCGGYFPLSEFTWAADGTPLGEVHGEPGKDLREPWPRPGKVVGS